MAVKCNITGLALNKLNELYWGTKSGISTNNDIYKNYIEFVGCSTVTLYNCKDTPCSNPTVVVYCKLRVADIQLIAAGDTFNISVGDITGGLAPYTYVWTYDDTVFDLISGTITSPVLVLRSKAGINPTLIVSKLKVAIRDADGCTDYKSCYLTQVGFNCTWQYTPCDTATNFQVIRQVHAPGDFPQYNTVFLYNSTPSENPWTPSSLNPSDTDIVTPTVYFEENHIINEVFNYGYSSRIDTAVQLRFNNFPALVGSVGSFTDEYDIYESTDGTNWVLTNDIAIDSAIFNSGIYTVNLHYFANKNRVIDFRPKF